MTQDRHQALLDVLLRSHHPLSGDELASRLHVSTRSIRSYVREINSRSQVIVTSHRGYFVDARRYADLRQQAGRSTRLDTPHGRLAYICRELAKRSTPVDIFALADDLSVSEATLEADLTRAREVFCQHDLVLKREHDLLHLEGSERSRRRLMRQILHTTATGLVPATWQAFVTEYSDLDVPKLKDVVTKAIDASNLEFSEYAISDVVAHLAIAVERILTGHTLSPTTWNTPLDDPAVLLLTGSLVDAAQELYSVSLPESEREALYSVLAVRAVRGARSGTAELVVDPQIRSVTAELLNETADRYLLSPPDPSLLLNLALHVQNVVARAKAAQALRNPLGDDFKNGHPLIHDIALYFTGRLEAAFDIVLEPGEVDYLSFHMGMQFLRGLEQRDLVTITLVVPRYYDMASNVRNQLQESVNGQALVERVLTKIDADFTTVSSDVLVTCIEPAGPTSAPVVMVSPFLTNEDRDRVLATVRRERERNARRRVRTALSALLDPQLFFRVTSVDTKEDALAMMCGRMATAGYVGSDHLLDVLDRERRSSTSFGGEFAIPHSMYMDARETAISVLVSDRGIPWGSSSVRLVVMFALSPDGRQTFRDVLEEVARLLSEKANITTLLDAADSFDSFMSAFTGLLD